MEVFLAFLFLFSLVGFAVFLVKTIVSLFTKKKLKKNFISSFVCLFLIIFSIMMMPSTEKHDNPERLDNSAQPSQNHDETPNDTSNVGNTLELEPVENTPFLDLSFDTTGYMGIDADVLFEYGNYLGGQKVITVITADNVDTYSSMIKAKTSNNDGYFFSIVCEFVDKTVVESVEEGAVITVAGTLQERNPLVDTFSFLEAPTATLENCSIIGFGEIAQELAAGASDQQKIGESAKSEYEAQIAAEQKEIRDDYISQCETVNYSDVERNPDNYNGKMVKITGKVIQVSEGWLDSVTLRVSCGGNVWLVSYSRGEGESRILEDDSITCYGKCTGVTSYTTVLGSKVTVPSMTMEYYK